MVDSSVQQLVQLFALPAVGHLRGAFSWLPQLQTVALFP